MSFAQITIAVILVFIGILVYISYRASKNNIPTPDDYFLGGRGMGTVVLLMTMGASYFSTWTLLGAYGAYYRTGIWFTGFAVWSIFHALFIWLFGVRIWMAGKRYNFVTPGQMIEHYYKSPTLRLLFAIVGIVGLVPYMLIQVTGGAKALDGLTGGAIPYFVGVTIMSVLVGILVLLSGYRGAAWTDTFMGVFFGSIIIVVAFFIVGKAGGLDAFRSAAEVNPNLLINPGNIPAMLELMAGLGLGFWVMPHMWQKYYSAKSAETLGKVSVLTPFWNCWLMATVPLFVGIAANVPGVVPGLDATNSDQLIPMFFATYAPMFGTVVIAGILAAGISTINSQLLSSASIFVTDIWERFSKQDLSKKQITFISRLTVIVLTTIVFVLALTPGGSGFLVPVSALGFGIVLQLVPAALGTLYWKWITPAGAITGLILGVTALVLTAVFQITTFFGPGLNGIIVNFIATVAVSRFTKKVSQESIQNYHGFYKEYLKSDEEEIKAIERGNVVNG
jgi:SSS family solute:Na+ symporter